MSDDVHIAPNVQSTKSTYATVATANNNHHQQVHIPSQQASAAAEVEAEVSKWNKGVAPFFSVGSNDGREDAWKRSGGPSSTEERVTAERANRRGMFNKGQHKDTRVNKQRNNGRNNRDLLVAKRRQEGASPPTTGRRRSLRGSRTIAQTPAMWENIAKNPHMFEALDPQTDGEAAMENN